MADHHRTNRYARRIAGARITTSRITLATLADIDAIRDLQRRSMARLGVRYYGPQALDAAIEHVCRPDVDLVRDGTYFVAWIEDAMVGCGGWSTRRRTFAGPATTHADDARIVPGVDAARIRAMFVDPYTAGAGIGSAILERCEAEARAAGFDRCELGATLSGEAFYLRRGYVQTERVTSRLADGTPFEVVMMTKSLQPPGKSQSSP